MPAETHVEQSQPDRNSVFEIIREQLSDILEIDPSRVTESSSFVEDLEADSLALIELVEGLEEELSERTAGFRIEDEDLEDLNARACLSSEEVFENSDFVSLHCPGGKDTHHLIGADAFAAMRPGAFLINTARGPIVNQRDLTEVLQKKKIAGAGLDVLEKEPPDPEDSILSLDNVILAPHALAWTDQLFAAIGRSVVESVLSMKNGKTPQNPVNRDVLQKTLFLQKLDQYQQQSNPNS